MVAQRTILMKLAAQNTELRGTISSKDRLLDQKDHEIMVARQMGFRVTMNTPQERNAYAIKTHFMPTRPVALDLHVPVEELMGVAGQGTECIQHFLKRRTRFIVGEIADYMKDEMEQIVGKVVVDELMPVIRRFM